MTTIPPIRKKYLQQQNNNYYYSCLLTGSLKNKYFVTDTLRKLKRHKTRFITY